MSLRALLPRLLLALALALGLLQLVLLWPRLPATVASHYDLSGEPDGWMGRGSFVGLLAGSECVLAVVFLALVEAILRGPPAWFHLPHKGYWLAPERAASTRARLALELSLVGAGTFLLLYRAAYSVYLVSTGARRGLGNEGPVAAGFVILVLGWAVWVGLRYRRVPEDAA